jgi:hypothetical protein
MERFSRKSLRDLGVDGRIILNVILKQVLGKTVDWILLAQDGVHWWSLVNIMNLRAP